MRLPGHVVAGMVWHLFKNSARGRTRSPFVMMLEPLYACNLACVGCALERHTGKLKDRLSVERCLAAVEECGAPMVSVCGGEPTLYPELPELLAGIIRRRRHVYLCTNGLLLDEKVFGVVPPNKRLTINVHLDGMRETHDRVCAKEGVFDRAIRMIRDAKARGFRVMTNTTVFKETEVKEVEALAVLLAGLGVDGMLISPGYHYESVERDIFLTKSEIQGKFGRVLELSKRFPLTSTPMFLEFAAGLREYKCSPWSTVTFTPLGWKAPCYLIGKSYVASWDEFWNTTDWEYWESRQDPLCKNCAMHSGFEASAVMELRNHPRDALKMLRWNLGV
jgi:hopanoid biosynthesis associated radical SAM protein HpnH